ncbi:MAG: hypothetical protein WC380_00100 [Pedobacter sp.]|jgi:hypothetical protein
MNPYEDYQSEKGERLESEYYEDKSLREREDRVERFIENASQKPWIIEEEIF